MAESLNNGAGLVLAGGRAERLGGVEKGLLDWRGRPLISTALEALRACCHTVAISANREQATYAALADAVLGDASASAGAGPLAGILAGLSWAEASGFDGVLVMPCDTPYVDGRVMRQLRDEALEHGGSLTVARVAGRLNPLHGYFPVAAIDGLRAFLQAGDRKVGLFLEGQSVRMLDLAVDPTLFHNLNTDADWHNTPGEG